LIKDNLTYICEFNVRKRKTNCQKKNFKSEKEKLIVRKKTLSLKRKYGRIKQINIVERDAFIPQSLEKEIREFVLKRKSVTPTEIAAKFDVRVSTVKLLLKQYEEEGIIKLYDPKLKIKVYIPVE